MTKRAVIIGLLLGGLIAGFTHINNNVIQQNGLIEDYMPISVYGLLVLSLITVNPLLRKFFPSSSFKGSEYAVILAISLVACSVPGSGLMRFFPNAMMLPHQWVKTRGGWAKEASLQKLPPYMLAGRPAKYTSDDFTDPADLCANWVKAAKEGSLSPQQARVWAMVEDADKQALESITADTSNAAASAILIKALNRLLPKPDLFQRKSFPELSLKFEAGQVLTHAGCKSPADAVKKDEVEDYLRHDRLRVEQIQVFNRHLIDGVWPSHIYSREARYNKDLSTYLMGQGDLNKPAAMNEVPWAAWARPLAYWLPIFLILSIGVIGFSLVIHTQWSHNERLPYPIVKFTTAMLPDEEGTPSTLYKEPGFWWAGGVVVAIFMLNYANLQYPEFVPRFPMELDFSALGKAFKSLDNGGARWAMLTVRIVPISIGIAYLVRSDVAFSVGVSVPLNWAILGIIAAFGVNPGQSPIAGGRLYSCSPMQLFTAGAALAFALQIFYFGRTYYFNVLKRAVFVKAKEEEAPQIAVIGARLFMLSATLISIFMICSGVDWFLAIAYVLIAFILFLVLARILAETGIFSLLAGWYPCTTILGLLGINAIGPGTAIVMFMFSTVLLVRPRECLMPFAVGALKLLDDQKVKPQKAVPWMVVGIVLAIVIAVPISLRYLHGTGSIARDGWANAVSQYSFAKANHMTNALKARDRYEEVEATSGFGRIPRIEMDAKTVTFFIIGALVVLALSAVRLKYRWWPLHPVFILIAGQQSTVAIWHSFFIGWVIRMLVVKYGGHKAYSKVMPIMMGMIAGNILGLLLPNVIGGIFFFATGERLVASPMF